MITHEFTFLQSVPAIVIASLLFIQLVISYLLGYRFRIFVMKRSLSQSVGELAAINGALLGLLALLLAFTFSMANERYDQRRALAIEEANAIGTVILRTDIYPDSVRQLLRAHLKDYLEARIAFFQPQIDLEEMIEHFKHGNEISSKVWKVATDYARIDGNTTRASELIPALNDMFDITTSRRAAGEGTIPDSILYFLFILCLCASFLLGYDHKNQLDWIVVSGFSLMLSVTVFTIIDMDRPRGGFINLDVPNEKLIELRTFFSE